jgi:hypothetical protein
LNARTPQKCTIKNKNEKMPTYRGSLSGRNLHVCIEPQEKRTRDKKKVTPETAFLT